MVSINMGMPCKSRIHIGMHCYKIPLKICSFSYVYRLLLNTEPTPSPNPPFPNIPASWLPT